MEADINWLRSGVGLVVFIVLMQLLARRSGVHLSWVRIGAVSAITGLLGGGTALLAIRYGADTRDLIVSVFFISVAVVLDTVWLAAGRRHSVRDGPATD